MVVSKLYRTCGQTLLPVIMFNYYICLYNNVYETNGNKICLNFKLHTLKRISNWTHWRKIQITKYKFNTIYS